jgi:hypothetical protein
MEASYMSTVVRLSLGPDRFGITKLRVRQAMREFDKHFRGQEPDTGTRFAVIADNRRYPPKRLLALTIGRTSTLGFSGGKQTNSIFKKLGFHVSPISALGNQIVRERKRALRMPVPQVKEIVRSMFRQRWRILNREVLSDHTLKWPGLYLLAYGNKQNDLDGKPVRANEILYVGMSNHATLNARLGQFLNSIKGGRGHSAGQRIFAGSRWRAVPKAKGEHGDRFYFASMSVPCITKKGRKGRTSGDLKKMGIIAAAEQFTLARVLDETHREPRLNKQ